MWSTQFQEAAQHLQNQTRRFTSPERRGQLNQTDAITKALSNVADVIDSSREMSMDEQELCEKVQLLINAMKEHLSDLRGKSTGSDYCRATLSQISNLCNQLVAHVQSHFQAEFTE